MPKTRILVVEDETIVAMDIEQGLQRLGYEVVGTTNNGPEAIRTAGETRPDLILMDVQLVGEMSGIEAAGEIRKRFRIPIVFLTAYADAVTVQRAKLVEPYGYLLKPFEDQELHTALEVALHKHRAEETALRDATEALRQSEERFQLLVQSLPDHAVFLLDRTGHVTTWNPGAERIEGYSEKEILGQHLSIFYPPEEIVKNQPEQVLWTAEREGKFRGEGWRVRKDGSRFWADLVITPLRSQAGELLGFAKIVRDATERKQAEEAIRSLNASLEQRVQERTAALHTANQDLEAFTYSVAHDLRAPLRALRGYLSILQEDLASQLGSDTATYLGRSLASAEQMNVLIDDLLHLSRVTREPVHAKPVALQTLVEEARQDLQPASEGRRIDWRIDPLPVLNCDAGLMKQVFTNLLSNALKYTRPRAGAVIHVGSTQQNGEQIVFVRDNGIGFDPEQSAKLFVPFERLHSRRDFEGTGVGLAIVERIIRRHGGRIWGEGKEDQGATFYFVLGKNDLAGVRPSSGAAL